MIWSLLAVSHLSPSSKSRYHCIQIRRLINSIRTS